MSKTKDWLMDLEDKNPGFINRQLDEHLIPTHERIANSLERIANALEKGTHVTIDHGQIEHINSIDHAHIDDIDEIHGDVTTHPKPF